MNLASLQKNKRLLLVRVTVEVCTVRIVHQTFAWATSTAWTGTIDNWTRFSIEQATLFPVLEICSILPGPNTASKNRQIHTCRYLLSWMRYRCLVERDMEVEQFTTTAKSLVFFSISCSMVTILWGLHNKDIMSNISISNIFLKTLKSWPRAWGMDWPWVQDRMTARLFVILVWPNRQPGP